MISYEAHIISEVEQWKRSMQRRPSLPGRLSARVQAKMNGLIPHKVHVAITAVIKQMTRGVLLGAGYTTKPDLGPKSLEEREERVVRLIEYYRLGAATEGAVTGGAGILLGLADFPAWLALKMKMLFAIGAAYGYDTSELRERLFLLYIFQITFSSQQRRNELIELLVSWEQRRQDIPEHIDAFDWRRFQQEYRDYLDIAKLLQLVPGIGAVVGAYVNHSLTRKLGRAAMNAYRLRWMSVQGGGVP